jgi:hypothetical protein
LVTSENYWMTVLRSDPMVTKPCSSSATFTSSAVFSWAAVWAASRAATSAVAVAMVAFSAA